MYKRIMIIMDKCSTISIGLASKHKKATKPNTHLMKKNLSAISS